MAQKQAQEASRGWKRHFSRKTARDEESGNDTREKLRISKWNMGMLNDPRTIEVPGSVLLLSQDRNEPLGLRHAPARTSHSSLPTGMRAHDAPSQQAEAERKMTKDGQIILEPQPDDSHNDPLNWPAWRRDLALLSLGLYCCIGGGITPLIAAGFTNVAEDYHVEVSQISLTTGLYMMGLAIGSVFFSPTAILYGKRPVYLFSSIIFILSSVWCALSPTFTSLILARIFQGIAVSPVECLPSATIAEIFFLHERAFRIGIYTLLLLGGKNLIPLVSAAIIQSLSWRWVFWVVAIVVGFGGVLLFFFVPETFWDRTPVPKSRNSSRRPSFFRSKSSGPFHHKDDKATPIAESAPPKDGEVLAEEIPHSQLETHRHKNVHVGFASDSEPEHGSHPSDARAEETGSPVVGNFKQNHEASANEFGSPSENDIVTNAIGFPVRLDLESLRADSSQKSPRGHSAHIALPPKTPNLHNFNSPYYKSVSGDYFERHEDALPQSGHSMPAAIGSITPETNSGKTSVSNVAQKTGGQAYTYNLRKAPAKSFSEQLRIYHGRLNPDKWWKAAVRPFVLFAYPAVLWSSAVYACSIGWLIVISESVAIIYREGFYQFGALKTGLVYLSPFIGGVLGTAFAGKVSDIIVKAMARRNGGLYEPEFRLVMAIPVAITTVIGLMGFGWSASVDDPWIVPTVFFGIVSFGCSLGSTTSITFCVDSYRQYAGEALVTLNFSKNIFHGLVFSLFVSSWLTHDGSKTVFVWIGIIQLIVLATTIPMYIFGKRARMWTVRMNLMEKF